MAEKKSINPSLADISSNIGRPIHIILKKWLERAQSLRSATILVG